MLIQKGDTFRFPDKPDTFKVQRVVSATWYYTDKLGSVHEADFGLNDVIWERVQENEE
jgi:hypothetical protein